MGGTNKLTLKLLGVMLVTAVRNRLVAQRCFMAAGDKYVATLACHWGSDVANQFNNVFAYEGGVGGSTAADLADAIGTSMVSVIVPITAAAITYDTCTVVNLDDLSDFAIRTINTTGSVGGQVLPKFNAWAYRYYRATREVANGRKSFAGVPEAYSDNGNPSDSTVVGLLDDLAEFLGNDLEGVGAGITYIPRIWRRAGIYASGTDTDTFYPISAVGFMRISTQNTRK